jgi:hypothetical protein
MDKCDSCGRIVPLMYKDKTQCQACYRRERRRERGLQKPGPKPRTTSRTHCQKGHELTEANSLITEERRANGDVRRRARCRACYRNAAVARIYGLTLEQYDELFQAQEGCCAICRHQFTGEDRDTHVDHCHSTGRVRGLLCPDCNRGIGLFKDDIALLQRALEYVS